MNCNRYEEVVKAREKPVTEILEALESCVSKLIADGTISVAHSKIIEEMNWRLHMVGDHVKQLLRLEDSVVEALDKNIRNIEEGVISKPCEAVAFLREYLMEIGELQNGCVERALEDIEEALQ